MVQLTEYIEAVVTAQAVQVTEDNIDELADYLNDGNDKYHFTVERDAPPPEPEEGESDEATSEFEPSPHRLVGTLLVQAEGMVYPPVVCAVGSWIVVRPGNNCYSYNDGDFQEHFFKKSK